MIKERKKGVIKKENIAPNIQYFFGLSPQNVIFTAKKKLLPVYVARMRCVLENTNLLRELGAIEFKLTWNVQGARCSLYCRVWGSGVRGPTWGRVRAVGGQDQGQRGHGTGVKSKNQSVTLTALSALSAAWRNKPKLLR